MFGFMLKEAGKTVHVNDMDSLIGKASIIDIREPYEYRSGSLRTAKNIPMGTLLNTPDQYLDKEKEYYILCQSGGRSGGACRMLSKLGYQVVNVVGGMGSYVGTKRK